MTPTPTRLGRPPGRTRTVHVQVRLTVQEHAALQAALEDGEDMSDFVRTAIRALILARQ